MCFVSVVYDYGRGIPLATWTPESWIQYQDVITRLGGLDERLNQPDCDDAEKAAWMEKVEKRLAKLEGKKK